MSINYDVVILGGGTGGYVAAIKAAQSGLKTAIVEQAKLGGTCLHAGCIPSKALLKSAEVYKLSKEALQYGVAIDAVKLNFSKVQERKQLVVDQLYKGVQGLIKKGKIDVFIGKGRILGPSIFSPIPGTISVENTEQGENIMLVPKNVIIATGSRPRELDIFPVDGQKIVDSEGALQMEELPSKMVIIGGGVIGIEWASLLNDFDVEVIILEVGPTILPTEDQQIAQEMQKHLVKRGIKIYTDVKFQEDSLMQQESLEVSFDSDGIRQQIQTDKILVSVGRTGNVEDIGLQNTEIALENGFIKVNKYYQTAESHIYAIGDVIGGLQLAHVASAEGSRAISHIINEYEVAIDPLQVPKCIYASPQIASIGFTEHQAKKKGIAYKAVQFPFQAIGKALIQGEADGFIKVLVDENSEDLLGIHIIGPNATELIAEGTLAMFLNATPWEISKMIHPHPSLSEIYGEASLAIEGKAIHF